MDKHLKYVLKHIKHPEHIVTIYDESGETTIITLVDGENIIKRYPDMVTILFLSGAVTFENVASSVSRITANREGYADYMDIRF